MPEKKVRYIADVHIRKVYWDVPNSEPDPGQFARRSETPPRLEEHEETILSVNQSAQDMEGAIIAAQRHMDVVLGLPVEDEE